MTIPNELWQARYLKRINDSVTIEVRHFIRPTNEWYHQPNRWCVYAYIREDHPMYKEIDPKNYYQSCFDFLPLHGGCTYISHETIRQYGVETKVYKIGADYSHSYDERFYAMSTPAEAAEVFADAEALGQALLNYKPAADVLPS